MGGVSPLDATILYIYLNLLKWISQLALGDCNTICSNGRKWSVINVNKCQISRICHLVAGGADRYSWTVHCPSSVKLCWECPVLAGAGDNFSPLVWDLRTPDPVIIPPAASILPAAAPRMVRSDLCQHHHIEDTTNMIIIMIVHCFWRLASSLVSLPQPSSHSAADLAPISAVTAVKQRQCSDE